MTPNDQPEAEKLTLTREQILAMPAGRSLDALVAELIFGWKWEKWIAGRTTEPLAALIPPLDYDGPRWNYPGPESTQPATRLDKRWNDDGVTSVTFLPLYSEDIAHTWDLVEKMGRGEQKSWFEISIRPTGWCANMTGDPNDNVYAETAPLAIVKAALLTQLKDAEVRK